MGHLKEMLQKLKNNQVAQSIGLVIYIALTTFWVRNAPDSVFAFVFFIGSMLLLYYIKIPVLAKICFGAVMVLVIIPLIGTGNAYYFDVITQILIYMALALGLNIVLGFSGLFNMGYAAFYAVGAYLWAIFGSSQASHFIHWAHFPLNGNWFWIFLLLGITVTAGVGVLLGLPMMKVRGDYLAVVTLGFGEIVQLIFNNLNQPVNITNGPEGISSISPPSLLWMRLDKPSDYYVIALLMVMLVFIVSRRLEHSRIGRAWAAIREDEVAAKAMGVEVMRAKLPGLRLWRGICRGDGSDLCRQADLHRRLQLHVPGVFHHPGDGHFGRHRKHSRCHGGCCPRCHPAVAGTQEPFRFLQPIAGFGGLEHTHAARSLPCTNGLCSASS